VYIILFRGLYKRHGDVCKIERKGSARKAKAIG
jgi:hypothetical protein